MRQTDQLPFAVATDRNRAGTRRGTMALRAVRV